MTSRGFTLVEMAIVVAIAGILLAIAIPRFQNYIDRTRIAQSVVDIDDMSTTIKKQQMSNGALPDALADLGLDTKLDPWGHQYQYANLVKNAGLARTNKALAPINSDFDLYSMGADGLSSQSLASAVSRDDIVRGRNGGFVGLASDLDP